MAEMTKPPHQQTAAAIPALRGPARSSQPPISAAAQPRKTMNIVNVGVSRVIFQSQRVVVISAMKLMSLGQATELLMPMALDSGNQNTEKPYAMPIHRWIARAAGGTSQRLNSGPAIVRSLLKNPGEVTTVDMGSSRNFSTNSKAKTRQRRRRNWYKNETVDSGSVMSIANALVEIEQSRSP